MLILLLFLPFYADAVAPELTYVEWSVFTGLPEPPALGARSFILVDGETGTVLAARNPDLIIPPASLAKVVAIDVALQAVSRGELSLDSRFAPSERAWARNQAPGSSLMFLGPGQELSVRELLLGLSVSSGNDAAVALADLLDGGMEPFVGRMNARVASLGLPDLFFEESSGLSSTNFITAESFARFLLNHLEEFPQATGLYAAQSFTYPSRANLTVSEEEAAFPPISQTNRNLLLATDSSVDGIKTGFIEASGYNFAVSAERDGRRLIAVILGISAPNHAVGGELRAAAGAALLDYGFEEFELVTVGLPAPRQIRVYGGTVRELTPERPDRVSLVVPRYLADELEGRREQIDAVIAPFPRSVAGTVSVVADGVEMVSVPMTVPAVESAGIFRRVIDSIGRFVRRLGEGESVVEGADLAPAP